MGAVELTRSGAKYYQDSIKPCILLDSSRIKSIEDILGTSDGLIRCFKHKKVIINEKTIVVFGLGKVGRGAIFRLEEEGAKVIIVELASEVTKKSIAGAISFEDQTSVINALNNSDIVITATGVKHALASIPRSALVRENRVLVNLGAEDEYGNHIEAHEVFNRKNPANFILSEPTRLKYLDAPFALHNHSAVELINGNLKSGLNPPALEIENKILNIIKKSAVLWQEICSANLQSYFSQS